ncbi:MAG: dienelactone hydrolase family protein [Deltaproteobacteria bacterium]|nr:dienelactone hydrolase family protein [Deltaproteobacteria bacterium]
MTIQTKSIAYRDGDVALTGHLAWDGAGASKRPGILVVHGGAGLDSHAKSRTEKFAAMGFVALACDMFGDGVAGERQRVMAKIMELRSDRAKLCNRALAGIDVLRAHPSVDGRVAAVGYCFGGMSVLELARSGADVLGVVSVHGSLETSKPAETGAVKAKILVCHGALDPHVPLAQVSAFMEEMNRATVDWQLIAYGGAVHGFTHNGPPSTTPGVAYHAPTDARSTQAIRDFFGELFGAP